MPDWLRTILCWILYNEKCYNEFSLFNSCSAGLSLSLVVSKFLFSYMMPDMKILFSTYLISTLGQILIKFFYFSWIWGVNWESSGGLLNFCILSPGLSIPCCLGHLPTSRCYCREEVRLGGVGQLTPLMGERLWAQLQFSKLFKKRHSFVQSILPWMLQINGTLAHSTTNFFVCGLSLWSLKHVRGLDISLPGFFHFILYSFIIWWETLQ